MTHAAGGARAGAAPAGAAPAADASAGRAGPLAGVRVLDLTRLLPGPFCSLLLADFGADVVKVEDLGDGDYARWTPARVPGAEGSAASAFFVALNRNKRSLRLDLKHPRGRAALLRLARGADVLLESFRPGVMERLGVGHEALLAANPRLVVCPISGYGQDGPYRERSGHDLTYLAVAGVLGLGGDADGPPAHPAVQIADVGGGALLAAFGVMAALRHRDRTGEGQVVDVSMAHGALAWLGPAAAELLAGHAPPGRGALPLAGGVVCYRTYACRDGWVALAALEPKFWRAFCAGAGREDLLERRFDPPGSATHAELEALFGARTRAEWQAFADAHDCCLEPVAELEEALERGPLRDLVVELEQPGAERPVRVLGPPVRLSRTPADPHRLPAPALGGDTDAVLAEAGFAPGEIAALHAAGAVAGPAAAAGGSFLG